MFGAHEAQLYLTHWQQTLPLEISVPDRERPVTRTALIRVIRAELLPFITYGPGYERAVADNLRSALHQYNLDRGTEFAYWLAEALRAGTRARVHTIEPFDPEATRVTATPWCVSYTTNGGIVGAILNVHDYDRSVPNTWGGLGVVVRHPVYDGRHFGSRIEAAVFAYNAGLLTRYTPVYAACA
ncbi:hypothetical protein [Streptomyces sp. YIM S03343]